MDDTQRMLMAQALRTIADSLLVPVSLATRIPAPAVQAFVEGSATGAVEAAKAPKKRKMSAYAREYKRAFKRTAPKYKLKNGNWKKDGFKRAVRESHRIARAKRGKGGRK